MVKTITRTEPSVIGRAILALSAGVLALGVVACGGRSESGAHDEHPHNEHSHGDEQSHDDGHAHDEHGHAGSGSWSITAWGERFEVFPEIGALVAGEDSVAHTHVTVLEGFAPLTDGEVSLILVDGVGAEEVFSATEPVRPGIFEIKVSPRHSGEFDLAFRVESNAGNEEIRGGRVLVGTVDEPGHLIRAPAPRGGTAGAEPVPFLKEPQWQDAFATSWVREGALSRSLQGLAEVRPAAGGEAWITAPVEALVEATPWPYVGQAFRNGDTIFRLAPRVSSARSLAELESDLDAAGQELAAATSRLSRLEELLEVEATSSREVEDARTRVGVAKARHTAALSDLQAARAARQGGGRGSSLVVAAPFAGHIAEVEATPGAATGAADRLARIVRTDVVWLSVFLAPDAAPELSGGLTGVVLGNDHLIAADEARLVSVAPAIDPATGKLEVLVEIPGKAVPLGSAWDAQILLAAKEPGVVVPTSALVDDGGETVVYLQLGGETFVRQPVRVVARQGAAALVEGLIPGQRLVTQGGNSIRRSSLMASGAGHGHVH